MFLGGAGLADIMLYCRNRIYPLGLPNGVSHVITAVALVFGRCSSAASPSFRPSRAAERRFAAKGRSPGRFAFLFVTTLEKLLLSGELGRAAAAGRSSWSPSRSGRCRCSRLLRQPGGKLGRTKLAGRPFRGSRRDQHRGRAANVILDGETFRAEIGRPILLKPAQPLSFVRLAA